MYNLTYVQLKNLNLNVLFIFQKAMKDKDIDITELRQYHTIIGSKDENHHEPYKKEN